MPGRRVLCPRRPVQATRKTTGDEMDGARYIQHSDGTWEVVGTDGWPIPMDEYLELHADVVAALAAMDQTPGERARHRRHGAVTVRGRQRRTEPHPLSGRVRGRQ